MKFEDLNFDLRITPIDENTWEREKWRKEYPMDYLKALFILTQTNNPEFQAELFKTIYRISRLHVPDVLYKYYSLTNDIALNAQKLQTLQNEKIFMSDIKSFNDPFDGKGFFYNPDELKNITRLKPHAGRMIDDFTAFEKATSLTSAGPQSMPMWAHYANNHAGFCVAYDTSTNIDLRSCTFPVQYIGERVDVTSIMKKQAQHCCDEIDRQTAMGRKQIVIDDLSIIYMASLLCNLKLSSWSYEQEYRCTVGVTAEKIQYINASPKEIYIGKNCAEDNRIRLINIADSRQIPVYEMRFDDCSPSFELIPKRIYGYD